MAARGVISIMLTPAEMTDMQRYVADVAITASTLRDLRGAGFVKTARDFLAGLNLNSLPDETEYPQLTPRFTLMGILVEKTL